METNKKIIVVGSCNTDMVIRVDHLPLPGETIIGHDFITNQGGKGANQAVAVCRLGGETAFIARLGNDDFGTKSLRLLTEEGIDTSCVRLTDGVSTGVALIPVDDKGENSIIVSSGANALLSSADIEAAEPLFKNASILLMQLETPVPTLICAARLAKKYGAKVVLNPAPYPKEPLPSELLELVDIITPNETEAAGMSRVKVTDEDSAVKAICEIQKQGVGNVIITAGAAGAYTTIEGKLVHIPTVKAEVVDTTAAGDTFCGALCVALSKGIDLVEAIRFANKAASLSVTRIGAWMSIPYEKELEAIN